MTALPILVLIETVKQGERGKRSGLDLNPGILLAVLKACGCPLTLLS